MPTCWVFILKLWGTFPVLCLYSFNEDLISLVRDPMVCNLCRLGMIKLPLLLLLLDTDNNLLDYKHTHRIHRSSINIIIKHIINIIIKH